MSQTKNILFIMCDQLRRDYLSCYGHPTLPTPHIDRLAGRGVRFERAYAQSPLCGPSRACFYTGRYMSSHGSYWNGDPLKTGELTLGDYLRPLGIRTALAGKTHIAPNREDMARLGINPHSAEGILLAQGGFEPFERDDGLHPDPILNPNLAYNRYLQAQGYNNHNPWQINANSAVDKKGNLLSGWRLQNAPYPANIQEEHSETPYMTGRAIDCIKAMGTAPWCIHLSYIKPHWPYMAPAPYHNMFSPADILPPRRNEAERQNPHPVYQAFMNLDYSQTFARDEVRQAVIPTYMGLIKQIDDQIGRLMTFLEGEGYLDNTMIVFTSDHGDYLGDHWLGEKDLFHEESARIPLIIVDPSPEADQMRGSVCHELVESIDLIPTFLEALGGKAQPHRLEGRSLMPFLHNKIPSNWRDFTVSEIDYSGRGARYSLNLPPSACRATMLRTERWKYIVHEAFEPQLYDLLNDPREFVDLGANPAYQAVRAELHERLFGWFRQRKQRTTVSAEQVNKLGPQLDEAQGIFIGRW